MIRDFLRGQANGGNSYRAREPMRRKAGTGRQNTGDDAARRELAQEAHTVLLVEYRAQSAVSAPAPHRRSRAASRVC
jgi:hypothetical protein